MTRVLEDGKKRYCPVCSSELTYERTDRDGRGAFDLYVCAKGCTPRNVASMDNLERRDWQKGRFKLRETDYRKAFDLDTRVSVLKPGNPAHLGYCNKAVGLPGECTCPRNKTARLMRKLAKR